MASYAYSHHHQQRWWHPHDVRQQPRRSQLRLKCIVLGSAGAGKTSLLRRFVHGTFEGSGRAGNGGDPSGRGTASTLGADYYVTRVDNPLFARDSVGGRVEDNDDGRCDGHEDEKKQSPRSDGGAASDEPRATVQLWDTVGRSRLRPRQDPARYGTDVNFYQFLSARPPPDDGAAARRRYEHRYNNWGFNNGVTGGCFDAEAEDSDGGSRTERGEKPRRRGNANHRHRNEKSPRRDPNEPGGDALFRNVDACMLVYDAT